ncbi:MAG: TIGR03987 family protein [Prolixibacteraceae bacterium]|nr:TIGR03987 family protein [Prolixibacteraceae bacterium]MBN2773011.1 TIGR03987 family protein [Prolixibacteraceae bacterium]
MSFLLLFSSVTITLALIFYSLGIWAERISKYLKKWHVITFWIGFTFDVSGTTAMHFLATKPFILLDMHTLTGQIALWLMLAHAIWATVVVKKDNKELRIKFHRYSLFVWLIWLIPYFGGMLMGMGN